MDIEKLLINLKNNNYRITKARKDILTLLNKKPMSVSDLETEMKLLGHPNVQTIYNNLNFLETEQIIITTLDGHLKYYHLYDQDHDIKTKVRISCHATNANLELVEKKVIATLEQTLGLKNFNIESLDIQINGECDHKDEPYCEEQKTCMLKQLEEDYTM
jgi:Fe2+ or Zn2+ uptake regulation protein